MLQRESSRLGILVVSLGIALGLLGCTTTPVAPTNAGGSGTVGPATGGGASGTTNPPGGVTSSVNASLLEQLSLERINRARLLPGAEANANGIAIDEGIPGQLDASPKQPLALNAVLNQTAKAHSQDMITQDYFAHNTLSGVTPYQRMNNAGYVFITAGENLAWRGTTGTVNELETVEAEHVDLFVDAGVAGRGHRKTMLAADFREVGIGIVRGQFTDAGTTYDSIMQTQDYATATNSGAFVLGVVYTDGNHNNQYDYGEGVANSNVQLGDVTKPTNAAGGYSFEVLTTGNFTLRFLSYNKSQPVTINAGSPNIKVDLVSGNTIVVNLGVGPL
jgi:uncharacterized protein YkwD